MTYDDHKTALAKLIGEASYRHRKWEVFSDFVEMAAISIANVCMPNKEREQRYLRIIKEYTPMHLMGNWNHKLRHRDRLRGVAEMIEPGIMPNRKPLDQLELFA